jgi:hypothetical protein
MIITGKIVDYADEVMYISASFPSYLIEKREIKEVEIIVTDGRTITTPLRCHIYATLRDISLYTGHTVEELKDIFKADYIAKTGAKWFSLSDVDITTACDFLQHLIDFCLENWIPCIKDSTYLERSPDVGRYLYKCLATRTCAICGKIGAEVHHSGESKVGMGRNRKTIHHLGLQAVSLCADHHRFRKDAIHNIPEKEFFDKYHIWPIKLDEYLCKRLGLKV